MPLLHGKSKKAFSKNVETEMDEGKPQKQSLAIAYSLKRKAKKMADGGPTTVMSPSKTEDIGDVKVKTWQGVTLDKDGNPIPLNKPTPKPEIKIPYTGPATRMAEGGEMKQPMEEDDLDQHENEADADMITRIMHKRKMMSKGGEVANQDTQITGTMPDEFDDLHLDDSLDGSDMETGAAEGDELGNDREDHDRKDMVARIMRSRAKKDRNPNPA